MADRKFNVLFICVDNSARSLIAESLINRLGMGKFNGYSAGSHPASEINPFTDHILKKYNFITDELRCKDWQEFARSDAPVMDFVFTLSETASAVENSPDWPGDPLSVNWHVADPTKAEGLDIEKKTAFQTVFGELENRISIFVNLPIDSLDRLKLKQRLDEIGQNKSAASGDESTPPMDGLVTG